MVDAIAAVEKDDNDRPKEDIPMEVSILKKKEVRKLEKELLQEAFRKKLIMQ
jgi:peptidyl-prolyl cis-trans isomerase B (cyclophilin B)